MTPRVQHHCLLGCVIVWMQDKLTIHLSLLPNLTGQLGVSHMLTTPSLFAN